jgi:4'-phosphopantetheinyl transferase
MTHSATAMAVTHPVLWCRCTSDEVPAGDDWLTPAERAVQTRFVVPKRLADWRLGRWTAKSALHAAIGVAEGEVSVIAAGDGAPEPYIGDDRVPVSLSISHREGVGTAAVGSAGIVVGIDLEVVEPRTDAFIGDWFGEIDQQRIAVADDRDQMACLRWSIKEAAVKLLRTGLRLDVRSMEVRLGIEAGVGLWRPWQVHAPDLELPVEGWSLVDHGWITALAASPRLARVPPPASGFEHRVSVGSAGRNRWTDHLSARGG